MQNAAMKIIGRRPVYPVHPDQNRLNSESGQHREIQGAGEYTTIIRFSTNHTVTVLGRLSSYLSDK